MTRAGLKGAIEWAKVADVENGAARVYANALALLIEAAEAHLKTLPEPVTVTTYMVTAFMGTGWAACGAWNGFGNRAAAEELAAHWRRDPRYSDIKITEIVNHG